MVQFFETKYIVDWLCQKRIRSEFGQNPFYVLKVVKSRVRVYQDIIQVHSATKVKGFLKDIVYKSLKYIWCIAQAQWYDYIFNKAKSGLKCNPVVIIKVHLKLVITICKTNFDKDFCMPQSVQGIVFVGYRKHIVMALLLRLLQSMETLSSMLFLGISEVR